MAKSMDADLARLRSARLALVQVRTDMDARPVPTPRRVEDEDA